MKRILNNLYVMTQGVYLKKEGEAVVIRKGKETLMKFPLLALNGIICFGNIRFSPYLLGYCAEKGLTVSFLTEYGKFLFRVQGPVSGNVLLRKEQYRISDDYDRSLQMAKNFVLGKIFNTRSVLQRLTRDHGDKTDLKAVNESIEILSRSLKETEKSSTLDHLRGVEGNAANAYFNVFNELIVSQKADFSFNERNRRPPLDRVNALLSFTYTLLYHDVRNALESVGLDPAVGFLHRDRPGRYSLALDIMEEFRPFIADRLVLSLINLKQISGKDFTISDSGAVLMKENARKSLIAAYQKRKQDAIVHPYLNDEMHIGLLFHTQALLMARHIRGDIDGYPPFFWR